MSCFYSIRHPSVATLLKGEARGWSVYFSRYAKAREYDLSVRCPASATSPFRRVSFLTPSVSLASATFLREEGFYSSFSVGAVARQGD